MGSNLLCFFCYLDFAFNNVKDFYQNLYCKGVTMLRTSIKIYIAKVSHKGCRWYFMGFLKVSKWERVHFVTLKIIIFVLFTINLWNQYLSPLTLWVWIPLMVRWFSSVTLVSSKNKTNHHDIAEIIVESGVKYDNPTSYCSLYMNQVPENRCTYGNVKSLLIMAF